MPSTLEKPMITVLPTNICNLGCIYCPRDKCKNKKSSINLEIVGKGLAAARELCYSRVKFSSRWGDPMQHRDIVKMISVAKMLNYEDISLVTNGTNLADNLGELKESGLHRMCISLDTLNKNKYYKITDSEHCDHVRSSIEEASRVFENIKVNMVVMDGINQDEILDMLNWTSSIGITLQMLELVDRNDQFYKDHFFDLDQIIDVYKDTSELYSVDRIEKRTTITTRNNKMEFRQSRKWPNIFAKEERMLLHPDGTIGFWYNDRTDLIISGEERELINPMQKAMLKCIDFDQLKTSSLKGNMRMVS